MRIIILALVLILLNPTSATRPSPLPEAESATPGFGLPDFGSTTGDSFGIPYSGIVGGYGSGFGGPNGGSGKSGVVNQPLVCQDKGPCFQKQLTCPAQCSRSFASSGKGYGFGGGGGGCTFDCTYKCTASCAT